MLAGTPVWWGALTATEADLAVAEGCIGEPTAVMNLHSVLAGTPVWWGALTATEADLAVAEGCIGEPTAVMNLHSVLLSVVPTGMF